MDLWVSLAVNSAPALVGDGYELGRGALAGALVVGAAFLAGLAVFRRGSAAVCGLVMVLAAAALEFSWLGLFPAMSTPVLILLQGLFGAAALIFLSSTIRSARNNAVLGGVMFAAALSLIGIGVINLVGRADAGGLMRWSLAGVGGFAVILSLSQSLRDEGARLLLPGIVATFAAALIGASGGASLLPHALFTLGVLSASLVALTETMVSRGGRPLAFRAAETGSLSNAPEPAAAAMSPIDAMRVSENQLAQVLDYSGIAVWDWSPRNTHQTDCFPTLMGADSRGAFTPESIREFIHKDDVARFEKKVLDTTAGDGSFDATVRLHDGRVVRLRGARAVDPSGGLERLVAFAESEAHRPHRGHVDVSTAGASATAAKLAGDAPAPNRLSASFAEAIAKGEIQAAFQPIMSLESGKVAGYEALARWRGEDGTDKASADEVVKAAEASGNGRALASLVLKAAANHLSAEMAKEGRRDLFAAVNLSLRQISDAGFADEVRALLKEKSLPAKSLVLELTESEAVSDAAAAGATFKAMKDAGAALAFDDFGAGFSSLSNLSQFDFDYLKIDKSLIAAAQKSADGAKVARSLAALGKDLGLTVIAEGVETGDLATLAKEIGCAYGQGYALGEPSTSGAAEPSRSSFKSAKRGRFSGAMR